MEGLSQPSSLISHSVCPITGEPCCSKAQRSGAGNQELKAFLMGYKEQKSTVRTGCISCLSEGVRCDGSSPRCRKQAISLDWRINKDVAWQWHGTWRERRGINTFINFAQSPERAGLFESTFWHQTVMLACFNNEAVFHIAVGIGALHEHILQQTTRRGTSDNSGLSFALRECNRSINLLTASADDATGMYSDPGIILITCVLFAIFESLHGDPSEAIKHSLQGRKLVRDCETLASTDRRRANPEAFRAYWLTMRSRLVDPACVRPVVGGLEIQAKALQGKWMQQSDTAGEPPMPDVSHLENLEHANRTLHYMYISLLVFCQDVSLDMSSYELAMKMTEKYFIFGPWLKAWERGFADLLYRESGKLSLHDMQRAKVLKANHIMATMLTEVNQGSGRDAWLSYDNEFKAIIDLSASVLSTYKAGSPFILSTFQFPFLTFGLWVAEPLFLTMSRCSNPELRRQAGGLLSGQPRANYAQKILVRRPSNIATSTANVKKQDTDTWDIEKWINFAMRTRLDAGMATYFGRLPSEYIEKPTYTAKNA